MGPLRVVEEALQHKSGTDTKLVYFYTAQQKHIHYKIDILYKIYIYTVKYN